MHVIGTERHESRRIDNQLRGRAGRQGDPGSSRFYVSLQDDLMRIFGGETIEKLMDRLGIDESTPIENSLVSRSLEQAQKKVEGYNFDIRKHLVEYDDVMNSQREVIYTLRRKLLETNSEAKERFLEKLGEAGEVYQKAEEKFGLSWTSFVRQTSLQVVDTLWIEHLDNIDDLREGIGLRGYGGVDPLVEYKRESHILFKRLIDEVYSTIKERIIESTSQSNLTVDRGISPVIKVSNVIYRHDEPSEGAIIASGSGSDLVTGAKTAVNQYAGVGRNDPCPCGSGKKFKRCHGV